MNISRIVRRIKFRIKKHLISIVCYFNHRQFMKLYIPLLREMGIKFTGVPRYIGKDVLFDDFDKIQLGDRVVVSNDCHFLTHDYSYTTALISLGQTPPTDRAIVRGITVGNNVFIGKKSIIMPNTTIGNNVIIGAGSVVRGLIPNDSVVIGNPAKVIGKVTDLAQKWSCMNPQYVRIDKA